MPRWVWLVAKEGVLAFIDDEALSRGAAIAYYTTTSLAPVLLIVIAVAGLVFGDDAASGAIRNQVSGLMGEQSAEVLQNAIRSASDQSAGVLASIIGIATLLITASGVFGEMQTALNAIWRAKPQGTTVSRLVRARIVSLGLVAALGFLLLVSLAITAALTALAREINQVLPFASLLFEGLNLLISLALIWILFAAIYKTLPDRNLKWKDVLVGAAVTSLLFTIGKFLIGLYLGSSSMASSYGAAGGLIILLVWVYYSAQIFLLGAEVTKAYASNFGSFRGTDVAQTLAEISGEPIPEDSGTQRQRRSETGRGKLEVSRPEPSALDRRRQALVTEESRPIRSAIVVIGLCIMIGRLMALRK